MMLIFMFSMAGIPPLAGFYAKLYVFLAAVEAGLYFLAVVGLVTSVVGAYYYIRIVKVMYFDEPEDALDPRPGRDLGAIQFVAGNGDPAVLPVSQPPGRRGRYGRFQPDRRLDSWTR